MFITLISKFHSVVNFVNVKDSNNNLKMFTQTSRRKQSPQRSTIPKKKIRGLTEDQELQIKEAFSLFDPNQTSSITYHELKVILRALGFDVKKSEVVQMAKQYDIEETGRINFDDYADIMRRKYAERDPIQQTLKAFRLFDQEGKGKISLHDLKRVARELGQSLKEQQLSAMIDEFDADGDGLINQEQFLAIIRPSLT